MVGVDDSQADKTAEREIGSLLDNGYRMTVYHHAEEKLNPGGGTETIYSYKTCDPIAEVSGNFKSQLQLQGSGSLLDERVVTFIAACQGSCDTYCYELVEEGTPFGKGANNRPVIPYRTVAVDDDFLALGRKLYIPQLDGVEMPGDHGFIHNGCVLAGDTGSAIQGQDLDFFTPTKENGTDVEILLGDTVDLATSGHGNPIVDIYKGGEHCRNFGVNQGWIGDPCEQELDCMDGFVCAQDSGGSNGYCTLPECESTCLDLYEGGYEQTRCVVASSLNERFEDMNTACVIECSSGNDGEAPCREGLSCQPVESVNGGTKNVCI